VGKADMNYETPLRIVAIGSGIIVITIQGFIASRRIFAKKAENTESIEVGTTASESFWRDKFPMIVVLAVLSVPLVVLLLIVILDNANYDAKKYIVSDPVRGLYNAALALLAVGYLIRSIEDLTKLKKGWLKLLRNLVLIAGYAIYFFCLARVTEAT
jgi:hypothetical protein